MSPQRPKRLAAKKIDRKPFKTRWQKLIEWKNAHPILSPTLASIALMLVLFLLTQGGGWFQASILRAPAPFDGTVFPIKQVPHWSIWKGNNKTTNFNDIAKADLMDLPKYDVQNLAIRDADPAKQTDAQLTYPVVYMGNYENDHQEGAGSHLAIDIRVPVGTPVYSVANAKVVTVKRQTGGNGYYVVLEHRNVPDFPDASKVTTFYSSYLHMSAIFVEQGQLISKDHLIGLSGNTGTSTTPHLHFQIDRDTAPYHPFWPYTTLQASQANLSFFDAVTAGLGKDDAMKNTINPLLWVQANYNPVSQIAADNIIQPGETIAPSTAVNQMQQTPVFAITATKQMAVGTKQTITVEARDGAGVTDPSYSPSGSLQVMAAPASAAEFPDVISFNGGTANVTILPKSTGKFTITVKDGNRTASTIIEGLSDSNAAVSTTATDATHGAATTDTSTVSTAQNLTFEISGDAFGIVSQPISVKVTAKRVDGSIETNPQFTSPVSLKTSGNGTFSKSSLSSSDFTNGVAQLTYTPSGNGKSFLTAGNNSLEVSAAAGVEPVASFRVDTDGKYVKNKSEIVSIVTLDSKGQKTAAQVAGTVTVSIDAGQALLGKTELTSSDFTDGMATISLTPRSGTIKVRAQSGVLGGVSDDIVETTSETAFSDVPTSHAHFTAIKKLSELGIVSGYADGSFKPEKSVSRVEAAKMIVLGLSLGESPANTLSFSDTSNNDWYSTFVGRLLNMEVVKGYSDGSYKPNQTVNRAEYLKMLLLAKQFAIPSLPLVSAPYNDAATDAWFSPYAQITKEKNLLDAPTNEIFPSAGMTRGDVAETIYRLLRIAETGAMRYTN